MSQEEQDWESLSPSDKALTWAKENKFSVVAASWVVSMCGSFAYIQTQPMSFAQKLVQARVYAQGTTLASLVGMAALTSIPSAGDKIIEQHSQASEHSWQDVIAEKQGAGKLSQRPSSSSSSPSPSGKGREQRSETSQE